MRPDEFEKRMRSLEYFHALRFPPRAWVILRLDGRGFSRFTETRFQKPFDPQFHEWMVRTAQAVLEEFQGIYAYTESDEISILLPRDWALFDRELEKAVSLSAGLASAAFSLACAERVLFDSRACLAVEDSQAVDYFRWRQADAARCALNGWCYWTLRQAGKSVTEATTALQNKDVSFKNELLFQQGINFNDVPLWQRRGTGLYWETYQREGYNPQLNRKVMATRRRLKADEELPLGDDYASLVFGIMRSQIGCPQTTNRREQS